MKQLPCSAESETAILSACFLSPSIIPKVRAELSEEHFYSQANAYIFRALCDLSDKAEEVAVYEWLKSHQLIEKVGGVERIMEISGFVSTSAGWSYHANIIKEKSLRRDIIKTCEIAANAAFGIDEPSEIISSMKEAVREMNTQGGKPYRDNAELVRTVFKDIERRADSGNAFVGVPTGFKGIDDHVFGLELKTVTYLVARPSTGKTALALNIAENVEGRVLFFSLESNAEAITRRRLAANSKIYLWRLRTGQIEDGQWKRLIETSNNLAESKVIIFDKPQFRWIENLTAQCESMAMDGPITMIVIDHIGRCRTKRKAENQNILLGIISDEISDLAKLLNVPILVLCQLNREIEKRPAKSQYPRLSDIRESGRIEENADNVVGIWRKDKEAEETRVEWLKGRDVGTFECWLRFDRQIQKFYDSETPEEEPEVENYMDK